MTERRGQRRTSKPRAVKPRPLTQGTPARTTSRETFNEYVSQLQYQAIAGYRSSVEEAVRSGRSGAAEALVAFDGLDKRHREAKSEVDRRAARDELLTLLPLLIEKPLARPMSEILKAIDWKDLQTLVERVQTIKTFQLPSTPFYTLDELGEIVSDFTLHLEAERVAIEKTGLPERRFSRSEWLDPILVTYPTLIPWEERRLTALEELGLPETAFEGPILLDPILLENHPEPIKESLSWLNDDERVRVEKERAALVKVKIAFFECFTRAIRSRNGTGLWRDCLSVLSGTIKLESLKFFIRLDRRLGKDFTRRGTGTVSEMVRLTGAIQAELEKRRFNDAKVALQKMSFFDNYASYFEVVGGYHEAVNPILDRFIKLDRQVTSEWMPGFMARAAREVDDELVATLVVKTEAPRRDHSAIRADLEYVAATRLRQLKQKGASTSSADLGLLSHDQIEESRRKGFRSFDTLRIRIEQGQTKVDLHGAAHELSPALSLTLLQLVLAAETRDDHFLATGEVTDPSGKKLKNPAKRIQDLKIALGETRARTTGKNDSLIENKRGGYRLSLHRALILYRVDDLRRHGSGYVSAGAAKIPREKKPYRKVSEE
jgi:hypothetical protein